MRNRTICIRCVKPDHRYVSFVLACFLDDLGDDTDMLDAPRYAGYSSFLHSCIDVLVVKQIRGDST
ncbi:hypothetical protein DPMN_041045 [Dreissena polymorpha]|uniref:Uncharacterized protein n=1 Tax=Dreissena polymorpha TaxID=45954 RepID=A0A9D4HXI4_DREPO|nr:hypothetical protein DPMN_041045 [Dreissena polymorpha]